MTFTDFKKTAELLANKNEDNFRNIQALLTAYFKNKVIPHLDSLQQFVVRCNKNEPGEVFKNISRCSYNPCPENISLQRCNYPSQQLFYCSMFSDTDFATSSLTCLAETAWEHIEDYTFTRSYFTLSRWELSRPLKLWVLPFSDISCEKNNDFRRIRSNMENLIKEKLIENNEVIEALKYMSEVFCERKNKKMNYKISSAFFNSLLFYEQYMNSTYDGIIYPSANTDGAGMNIAIKKDLIDTKVLNCDLAVMYSMQRTPNNLKNLKFAPATNIAYADAKGKLDFGSVW